MEPRREQIGALPQEMTFEVDRTDEDSVLHVHGDLDVHTAGDLGDALAQECAGDVQRVVVDLTEVTVLDSVAIGVLVVALQRLRERAGTLELVCADRRLLRMLRLTRLEGLFRVHRDLSAASL
ncbi:MAG TPA: STAS domain-containing protein [Marmoricola sp.]|jgi:anti-sigma B factor antagonist|nr:STAS domain-containing protein [Marmoricola sp.]